MGSPGPQEELVAAVRACADREILINVVPVGTSNAACSVLLQNRYPNLIAFKTTPETIDYADILIKAALKAVQAKIAM